MIEIEIIYGDKPYNETWVSRYQENFAPFESMQNYNNEEIEFNKKESSEQGFNDHDTDNDYEMGDMKIKVSDCESEGTSSQNN